MKKSSVELIRQVQWAVPEEQGLKLQKVLDDETEPYIKSPARSETKMDAKERYVRVKNFSLTVNGDIGVIVREYTEPASDWSGKPEIAMVVAENATWVGQLHLQPHQFDELVLSQPGGEEPEFTHDPDCPCYSEQHSQDCANCECQCQRPPKGWRCTHEVGHAGPCAPVPVEPEAATTEAIPRGVITNGKIGSVSDLVTIESPQLEEDEIPEILSCLDYTASPQAEGTNMHVEAMIQELQAMIEKLRLIGHRQPTETEIAHAKELEYRIPQPSSPLPDKKEVLKEFIETREADIALSYGSYHEVQLALKSQIEICNDLRERLRQAEMQLVAEKSQPFSQESRCYEYQPPSLLGTFEEWWKGMMEAPGMERSPTPEEEIWALAAWKAAKLFQPSSLAGSDSENHRKVMNFGLRQLEWDHGGQFVDSNRVVDRHNREIVIAFEMGAARQQSQPVIEPMVSDAEIAQLINNINDFDGVHEVVECLKELQQFRKAQQERMR